MPKALIFFLLNFLYLECRNPDDLLEEYVAAGVDMITVHKEVTPHLDRTLTRIRELGCKAGVSVNPGTSLSGLEFLLEKLDLINLKVQKDRNMS